MMIGRAIVAVVVMVRCGILVRVAAGIHFVNANYRPRKIQREHTRPQPGDDAENQKPCEKDLHQVRGPLIGSP